ncbi:MAG: RNase adapter RapZ [Eubacteriales bacterium]|nr:RNase adapter RapZ [Eubacteriales bacterium]
MKLVILTGMSGAGKTIALKQMEDMGFYCADNLPISLLPQFAALLSKAGEAYSRVALGIDIRSGAELPKLKDILTEWDQQAFQYEILFLEASDAVLLKRFKETRRTHPLCPDGRIEDGIRLEREKLQWLKQKSRYILDTSKLLTKELKLQLERIYSEGGAYRNLYVTILSFGFKYGVPEDADLVFDVRFLPNPYYVDELRKKTGLSQDVKDYVMQGGDGDAFLKILFEMIDFLLPRYIQEGKNQLVIAAGCTGGKHRSVTVAEALFTHLSGRMELGIRIEHRDIDRK